MASISIEGREVVVEEGHLYLVFKADTGEERIIGGRSEGGFLPPFGNIEVQFGNLIDGSQEERVDGDGNPVTPAERGNRVLDLGGRDANKVWEIMIRQASAIDNSNLQYAPLGQNSNSTIASILNVVGIDVNDVLPVVENIRNFSATGNLLNFDYNLEGTDVGDVIHGAGGDDTFVGGAGDDQIFGGPVDGADENDGDDTVDYSTSTSGIIADLVAGTVSDGLGGNDTLVSIENIIGSDFDDTFKPSDKTKRIEGGGGTDTIDFSGATAGVTVDLGARGDDIEITDVEIAIGTQFDDQFKARDTTERIEGGGGTDTVDFSQLTSGVTVDLGAGTGTVEVTDVENIVGTDQMDRITGDNNENIIVGGGGNDVLDGGDDSVEDVLTGGGGIDTFIVRNNDFIADIGKFDRIKTAGGKILGGEIRGSESFQKDGVTYEAATLQGRTTLQIKFNGGSVTVPNWLNGDARIKLIRRPDNGQEQAEAKASPLVLDLDGDGIELLERSETLTYFDFDEDGFAERAGWIVGDDGFLALDRDGDGTINDVSELFGSNPTTLFGDVSVMPDVASGFSRLAELDSNADGVIDSLDTAFGDLLIWRDVDENGFSDSTELFTMAEIGIASINLDFTRQLETVGSNLILDRSTFTRDDGTTSEIADVFFSIDPGDTVDANRNFDISDEIRALPFIVGRGEVSDLDVAMARDPLLKEMVQELNALTVVDAHFLPSKVEAILFRWFGVEDVRPDSRGFYTNGQRLAATEKLSGRPFRQLGSIPNPRPVAGAILAARWQEILADSTAQFLAQIPLGDALTPGLRFDLAAFFATDDGTTLDSVLAAMQTNNPTDPTERIQYWHGMTMVLSAFRAEFAETDAAFDTSVNAALQGAGVPLSFSQIRSAFIGSDADETLVGTASSTDDQVLVDGIDILMGGGGKDRLIGGLGTDIYLFGRGHGVVEIQEDARGFSGLFGRQSGVGNTVRFLDGVAPGDVTFEASENGANRDLVVRVIGTDDELRVLGQFSGLTPQIEFFEFADGTRLEWVDIRADDAATAGDDQLFGFALQDSSLDGGPGDDTLVGSAGNDTYFFDAGGGSDVIVERARFDDSFDRVVFGPGIASGSAQFSRSADPSGADLIITFDGLSDRLTIVGQFSGGGGGGLLPIETFEFADGTVLAANEIDQILLTPTDGDDAIVGTIRDDVLTGAAGNDILSGGGGGDDLLDGGVGNDLLRGGNGADTYLFTQGSGHDRIEDTASANNVLRFGPGIVQADLQVARSGVGLRDITVQIAGTDDVLEIGGQSDATVIASVEFDDGTTLTGAQLTALADPVIGGALVGTNRRDVLNGDSADNRLDGGAEIDLLRGSSGNDVYVFGRGYGQDTIDDSGGLLDAVEFAPGVMPSDIRFEREFDDLILRIDGTDDVLTVRDGAGSSSSRHVEEFRFADGTMLTRDEILAGRRTGTAGDDHLFDLGSSSVTFDPGAGDDSIQGTDGFAGDVFLLNAGFGTDTIEDPDGSNDRVVFGAGINQADVALSREGRDLIVNVTTTGDRLIVKNQFVVALGDDPRIERIQFGDGSQLTESQIRGQVLAPTAGDDLSLGFGPTTLNAGAGNDRLEGDDSSTTYFFTRGSGNDVVADLGTGEDDPDTIRFGPNITLEDLKITRNGALGFGLIVEIVDTGETLTIEAALPGDGISDQEFVRGRIERFLFDDGTVVQTTDIEAQVIADEATDGDDTIKAFASDVVLDGGAGNDTYLVGEPESIISFGPGSGLDTVTLDPDAARLDPFPFGNYVVALKPGVAVGDVEFRHFRGTIAGINGDHLQILLNGGTDVLTAARQFSPALDFDTLPSAPTIGEVRFADGTTLNAQQIADASVAGGVATDGDDYLPAAVDGAVLNGGAGDDLMLGVFGTETFEFGRGSGNDRIAAANTVGFSSIDVGSGGTLSFIGGLTQNDINVRWQGDDFVFEIADTGETVTLVDRANERSAETVQFSDGTTVTTADLIAGALVGTAGDDILVSDSRSQTLDGGAGNDLLNGNEGSDTYIFGLGYGSDTITETFVDFESFDIEVNGAPQGRDVVEFGAGITLGGLTFTRTGDDLQDLAISINGTDDRLLIKRQLAPDPSPGSFNGLSPFEGFFSDPNGIHEFRFADGTTLERGQVADLVSGTDMSGNNTIQTGDEGGVLDGSGGQDQLLGGAGNDTYVFDRGYSEDRIVDAGGEFDTIRFGDNVGFGDVVFSRVGDDGADLFIEVGGEERLTLFVNGQFTDPADSRIEFFEFADGTVLEWPDVQDAIIFAQQTTGDDDIAGFDTDDVIDGGDGADTLAGGKGDDTLIGGDGRDTAVFSGSQADYTVDVQADRVIVTDLRADGDGQDTLFGVEDLRFDGDGSILNLTAVNQAPVAGNDAVVGTEDTIVEIPLATLLQNDSDPEGQPLELKEVRNAANGLVFVNLAGDVSFQPDADFFGDASFEYVIVDPDGAEAVATVTLTIANVNDVPVLQDVAVSGLEDNQISGTVAATDADGESVTFSVSIGPANGSVNLDAVTGDFVYTPNADFFGSDQFTVAGDDGSGGTSEAIVSIQVDAVNDAPVVSDASLVTTAGAPVSSSVLATDVDGDDIVFLTNLQPVGGTLSLDANTGAFSYTPFDGFSGADSFQVLVTDNKGGVDTADILVTVEAGDTIPVAGDDTATTLEDTPVVVDVLTNDSDADGDTISVSTASSGTNGTTAVNPDGTITYTPNPDFNGTDSFTYTVTDPDGNTDTATVMVTVDPVNDAPVAAPDLALTEAAAPVTLLAADLIANDSDVEGDNLTISNVFNATGGTATIDANGDVLFTPAPGFFGEAGFDYVVSDGTLVSEAARVTVTVSVNEIIGTSANNTLVGTAGADRILGRQGNDTITGGGGGDIIDGESGNDTLSGGDGDDVFIYEGGSNGSDSVDGGAGFDTILGGAGDDFIDLVGIDPADSIEMIDGGAGFDSLRGSSGDNTLDFTGITIVNIERIIGRTGNDTIIGSAGNDTIDGSSGNDTLSGGDGDDVFIYEGGSNGSDSVDGGAGFDTILGGAGDDFIDLVGIDSADSIEMIDGGAGFDSLRGSSGDNTLDFTGITIVNIERIIGRTGNDTIIGSAGNDTIDGSSGNDTLSGGDGDDVFIYEGGSNGSDSVDGGAGFDTILGGAGDDFIDLVGIDSADSIEMIDGGAGFDSLRGTSGSNTLDFSGVTIVNVEQISGMDGNDTIIGSAASDIIDGNFGNDTLSGGDGDDTLNGGGGNDVLNGGGGNDQLHGNGGNDTYVIERGADQDTVFAGAGAMDDRLLYGATVAFDQIWLQQSGNDLVTTIIGTTDQTTISGFFDPDHDLGQIETSAGAVLLRGKVDQLVSAMAAFDPPPIGQLDLSPDVRADLDPALTAAWEGTTPS